MNKLPLARVEDIIVQEISGEVLIYDLKVHKAFNLNETSSIIFQACDGKTTFAELKTKYKFTDELIFLALDQLKEENLLREDYISPFTNISRRSVVRRVGLASMTALPFISSLVAPTAAMASSCPPINPCTGVTIPTGCPCSLNCSQCVGACNLASRICV